MPAMTSAAAKIRTATLDDAAELARLATELGYPMSADEMRRRLGLVLLSDAHHVVVAEAPLPGLHGWAHVESRVSLEGGERAELMGLVVDATARRGGAGRALLHAAEEWARHRGLRSMTVRSNTARTESHPFYEAAGYVRSKTQHVYVRELMPRGPFGDGRD